jgi:hypothetical protein
MTFPPELPDLRGPTHPGGCQPGDAGTASGLSGELVFYLTDQTCHQTFQSTDSNSAAIDQIDSTHWTISWDDGGDCTTRDHDKNDLITSVAASPSTADSASGFYDGVNPLDISTPFGTKDSMRSEIIVPSPCEASPTCDPYQAGQVTDQEKSAKLPAYITFCGNAQCDAQVDVSGLPTTGSQPDAPIIAARDADNVAAKHPHRLISPGEV